MDARPQTETSEPQKRPDEVAAIRVTCVEEIYRTDEGSPRDRRPPIDTIIDTMVHFFIKLYRFSPIL